MWVKVVSQHYLIIFKIDIKWLSTASNLSQFFPHGCAVFHPVLSTMIPSQWRGGGLQFQDANMLVVGPAANIAIYQPVPTRTRNKLIQITNSITWQLGMHQWVSSKVINDKHPLKMVCRWKIWEELRRNAGNAAYKAHRIRRANPKDWRYLSCERWTNQSTDQTLGSVEVICEDGS